MGTYSARSIIRCHADSCPPSPPESNNVSSDGIFRVLPFYVYGHILSLGVFVVNRAAEDIWLAKKVQGWTELVKTLSGVSRKHPQSAYAGLQNSLEQEWAFVQRVTPGIGDAFGPVEQALRVAFIPPLFRGLV